MFESIYSLLNQLKHRIMLILNRAVVKWVNDKEAIQTMQVELFKGEVKTLPRLQNYGFTSHPKTDAEGLAVFMGGNRDSGVMVVVDDKRYRLRHLESGEVAIYTDEGDAIHLQRNNHICIQTKNLTVNAENQVTLNTPSLIVNGDIQDKNGTLDKLRQTYNSHTHIDSTSGTTSAPQQTA